MMYSDPYTQQRLAMIEAMQQQAAQQQGQGFGMPGGTSQIMQYMMGGSGTTPPFNPAAYDFGASIWPGTAAPGVATPASSTAAGSGAMLSPASAPVAASAPAGALGTAAAWGLPALAIGGMLNWESNTGTNSWGDQITDPFGSALRRGELHGNWLRDKLGDNKVVNNMLAKPIEGIGRFASFRPKEMWGGIKDMLSPITQIADLWD